MLRVGLAGHKPWALGLLLLLFLSLPVLLAVFEGLELLGSRFSLEVCLPFRIGHAVNPFLGFGITDCQAFLSGRCAVPLGQTVAAKISQDHQVDVLCFGVSLQVLKEAAEGCGFKFGLRL
jgi:hypothetical protein